MKKIRKVNRKDEILAIRKLKMQGRTVKEISKILNKPFGTINTIIRRHKIKNYCKECGCILLEGGRSYCPICVETQLKNRNEKKKMERMKNKKIKVCPICKKEFMPNHLNRIYCSDECAEIGHTIKDREWKRKNKKERIYSGEINRGFIVLEDGDLILGDFVASDFPTHGDIFSDFIDKNHIGNSNLGSHSSGNFEKEANLVESELRRLGLKKE